MTLQKKNFKNQFLLRAAYKNSLIGDSLSFIHTGIKYMQSLREFLLKKDLWQNWCEFSNVCKKINENSESLNEFSEWEAIYTYLQTKKQWCDEMFFEGSPFQDHFMKQFNTRRAYNSLSGLVLPRKQSLLLKNIYDELIYESHHHFTWRRELSGRNLLRWVEKYNSLTEIVFDQVHTYEPTHPLIKQHTMHLYESNPILSSYINEDGYLVRRGTNVPIEKIFPNNWKKLLEEMDVLSAHQSNDLAYFDQVLESSADFVSSLSPETIDHLIEISNRLKDI